MGHIIDRCIIRTAIAKSPVWLGWLRIISLNFLITLANETFILDDGNCIVTVK